MAAPLLAADIAEIAATLGDRARAFAGKRVLISGGRGFLGRYVIALFRHLNAQALDPPCRLVVLDNLITSGAMGADETAEGYEFIRHDVIEPFADDGEIDYILHLAGIASPFYYQEYPLETLDVAVTGARNMLNLAREKQARFLFFSSSEIYGDPSPAHLPTQESYRGNVSCLGPRACYDESKRLGETLCRIYHQRFGVPTTIVRPFNVFGPGMQETDYRVLPNFASQIVGGRPLTVYGDGRQTRTYCYVTDAMAGFMLALLHGVPGEPYNIGNPEPELSVLDLVERLRPLVDRPLSVVVTDHPDSYPADEPARRRPNIRKARTQLGYQPKVGIDEGLRRFLDWARAHYDGAPA